LQSWRFILQELLQNMKHETSSVIIIGSGIAGLATAIRLSLAGYRVTVYEKNAEAGGKISTFSKSGYQFDAGPSLLTQPEEITELFKLAGENMEEYLDISSIEVACKYFYEDDTTILGYTDAARFADEVQAKTGESSNSIKRYLSRSRKLYNSIGTLFLNNSLHKRTTWIKPSIFKAVAALKLPYLMSSLNRYHKKKFKQPAVRQLFNRFATYNGSNPYRAPAMLSMIPGLEHNEGVYYPKNGMISIPKALYNLAVKKGVSFHFNSAVDRIMHHEGKVMGVVAEGKNIFADTVISNADIYFTYKSLLAHEPKAKKLLKRERSSSALIFFWGVKDILPMLDLHNILFSEDYEKEFKILSWGKSIYNDPTIYINRTSHIDKEHAPAGSSNLFVMINAPYDNGQDWELIKTLVRKNVIAKLNKMLGLDIESLIESEQIVTPADLALQTSTFGGSLYGSSSNTATAAFFRHPNFSKYVKGLYFCGGTVHPGGGIPLCLKSASITASMVCKDQKFKQH
jgi:phytoene desaturase